MRCGDVHADSASVSYSGVRAGIVKGTAMNAAHEAKAMRCVYICLAGALGGCGGFSRGRKADQARLGYGREAEDVLND